LNRIFGIGNPIASHAGAPLLGQFGEHMVLTLDRPADHNRLDPADIDALQRVFDNILCSCEQNPSTAPRALVLTGNGGKSFCSGYTISAIGEHLDARFESMLDTLESLPILTVAAIPGGVYGGGTDLALCCDIRLGVPHSRMFMPAARFAIHYYPGGLRRYVTNLGLPAAKKLFLTALTIDAAEMLRIGFLSEIVEFDRLAARVQEYMHAIAETDSIVVAAMKQHLKKLADGQADFEAIAAAARSSLKSEESRRRLAALRHK
jgi:enoyl-CoA hydratase/carnithine racemase